MIEASEEHHANAIKSILFRPFAIDTSLNEWQFSNAVSSIVLTVLGMLTLFKPIHSQKAPYGMDVRPFGIVMEVTPLLKNAWLPISVSPFPKFTVERRRHSRNTSLPMTFTLSGMVTVLISSLPLKAASPILDTLDGMTTSAAVPLYFLSTPFSITNSSATDSLAAGSLAAGSPATDANVITSSASACSAVHSDVMSLLASPVESANTPVAGVMPNAIILSLIHI